MTEGTTERRQRTRQPLVSRSFRLTPEEDALFVELQARRGDKRPVETLRWLITTAGPAAMERSG